MGEGWAKKVWHFCDWGREGHTQLENAQLYQKVQEDDSGMIATGENYWKMVN